MAIYIIQKSKSYESKHMFNLEQTRFNQDKIATPN